MTRLSDVERAERKMVRARLEGMSDAELEARATEAGVIVGHSSRLQVINGMMMRYGKTWGRP